MAKIRHTDEMPEAWKREILAAVNLAPDPALDLEPNRQRRDAAVLKVVADKWQAMQHELDELTERCEALQAENASLWAQAAECRRLTAELAAVDSLVDHVAIQAAFARRLAAKRASLAAQQAELADHDSLTDLKPSP